MQIENPILAIDYGQKRIGLAISDSKGIIASPLDVLEKTKNRDINILIEDIVNILEEYRVKTILIGSPQIFQTTYIQTEKKIKKFGDLLKQKTSLPIIYHDESYSTSEAQNMLLSLGQNTKSTRHKIDKIAATVFLQEFLNSKQSTNENNI